MTSIADISRSLTSRAAEVARYLLPSGKHEQREWVVGSVGGEAGRSLKVCIEGAKQGVWSDFAAGDSGDLIDLWVAVRGVEFPEAMKEIRGYLGIEETTFARADKRKTFNKPQKPKGAKAITADSPVMAYLKGKRKLTEDTIKAFNIGECDGVGPWKGWKSDKPWKGPWMILPFRKGDEVSSIKYLHIELDRHGKKQTLVEPGCKPSLFGWKTIKSSDRAAVICEGEIDAMSLFQYGYPALSVPFGGGKGDKQQWVEYEWENLEQLETIYVCMDNDEEGEIATAELIERLGRHRCKIVTLPHKDANKCLQEGMTKEEIDICFVEAKSLDPVELKRASSFEDRTVERFYPPDGEVPGVLFPFPKLKNKLRARGGEVSMWTGINGHGKALGINTPILTETGWKVMQEIQAGDIVFDENGVRCNVIAVTDILRSRPCYKITFSDFSEIICDENHEWLTWTAKARQSHRNAKKNNRVNERQLKKKGFDQTYKRTFPSVVTAKHIAETVDIKEGCWEGKKEHSVKVAGPLSLPKQDLLIDPYLLGAWLGDGNSNDAGMTSADPQIIEYFKKDYDVTKRAAKYLYGINNGFLIHLRELNLLKNKHIPKQYLFGSDYQRLALLQGLMDTDGHIHDYGRCEFTSVKKGLADQTLFLVKSLGFQARMCTGRATINGKDCGEKYRITFTPDRQVFRLERKVKFVKLQISDRAKHRFIVSCKKIQSVPVKCIQVDSPSKLYLAGESLIPTHNSTLLGQCLMHFAYQGERVCVASLEMKPEATLGRIARQLTNERLPSREKLKKAFQWLHDKFWIFDVVGVVDADKVLEVFKYAYHRYGVTQFVIDSFMRCNIDEEDKKAQLDFMNKIVAFVNQYGGHIHIVAHPRKGLNEEHFVGKMDVKGSGCLTDLPWNVFSIWRNKAKEKALGGESFGAPKKKTDPRDEPDGMFICDKQREGEWENMVGLYFCHESQRYYDDPNYRAPNYLGEAESGQESMIFNDPQEHDGESLDEWGEE